ncbi:hypothetical protein B0H14DRAFT_686406 [Mycena olivaceomarginata]|nr:hypothetical protein B0H14DRAFT_686406 [Mycena olivaceomarginata]
MRGGRMAPIPDPKRAGKFYISGGPHLTDLCHYIFKAWCYRYEDCATNRQGHVSRRLESSNVFKFIAGVEPSSDLLHLLRHFNPNLWFEHDNDFDSVLAWLKKTQPLAGDLIQLWEDYHFMLHCEEVWVNLLWFSSDIQVTAQDRDQAYWILLLVSPSLIKILQATEVIFPESNSILFRLHIIFNFSWEELRAVICSLRSLLPPEGDRILQAIYIVAWILLFSCSTLTHYCGTIFPDLCVLC